jgi:hypothetical protein
MIDFGAAWALAFFANRKCQFLVSDFVRCSTFLVGSGLLLIAGIGRLGWYIQSFGGETSPESLDKTIIIALSLFGTFLLIYNFALGKLKKG